MSKKAVSIKCKVCGKGLEGHSSEDLFSCMKDLFSFDGTYEALIAYSYQSGLIRELGQPHADKRNFRIGFKDGTFLDTGNIMTDLPRIILAEGAPRVESKEGPDAEWESPPEVVEES
jgi:hypothetical protein